MTERKPGRAWRVPACSLGIGLTWTDCTLLVSGSIHFECDLAC